MINMLLQRDTFEPERTFGKLYVDGTYLGETLEDTDRHLEDGGEKVDKQTAIPRGKYLVSITFSQRFQRPMPLVHDVPGFEGIRIHGGNTEDDTEGCPLLGAVRTEHGIANCSGVNQRLMMRLEAAEAAGSSVWLTVA